MTPLALTAITNFILAGEVLFFAGLIHGRMQSTRSASYSWGFVLFFLGVSAMLGGIDHGFFEENGDTLIRTVIQRTTWFFLGVVTFSVLATIARQFLSEKYRRAVYIIGFVYLVVFTVLIVNFNMFLIVIAGYAPVMIIFLVLHIAGLSSGKGSWPMVTGIVLSFAASAVQMMRISVFLPLDHNGLYHVIMLVAAYFFYAGGLKLQRE